MSAWARFRASRSGMAGLVVLGLLALAALLGPALSPYGADEQDLAARNRGPSLDHPFGTASLGEDVLTRTLEAGRVSLLVGLATALAATAIGAGLGLAAGWWGGWVDQALGRLADLFLIVPAFVLLIVLSLAFERVGPAQVILILAVMSWMTLFRLTRASALRTRALPYVDAARAAGAGSGRILLRHLLPAAVPELTAFAALTVALAILAESALSFLGLGIDPAESHSWGNMMIGAQDTVEARPWLTLFPGAFIVLTVLAVGLVGDALRRALAPSEEPAARRLSPSTRAGDYPSPPPWPWPGSTTQAYASARRRSVVALGAVAAWAVMAASSASRACSGEGDGGASSFTCASHGSGR